MLGKICKEIDTGGNHSRIRCRYLCVRMLSVWNDALKHCDDNWFGHSVSIVFAMRAVKSVVYPHSHFCGRTPCGFPREVLCVIDTFDCSIAGDFEVGFCFAACRLDFDSGCKCGAALACTSGNRKQSIR